MLKVESSLQNLCWRIRCVSVSPQPLASSSRLTNPPGSRHHQFSNTHLHPSQSQSKHRPYRKPERNFILSAKLNTQKSSTSPQPSEFKMSSQPYDPYQPSGNGASSAKGAPRAHVDTEQLQQVSLPNISHALRGRPNSISGWSATTTKISAARPSHDHRQGGMHVSHEMENIPILGIAAVIPVGCLIIAFFRVRDATCAKFAN